MKVKIIESDIAILDWNVIKSIGKEYFECLEKFKADLEEQYNNMRDCKYNQNRYQTHILDEYRSNSDYTGSYGTNSFNIKGKADFRIVWKIMYDKQKRINNVNDLDESVVEEWSDILKQDSNAKLVYVARYCVDYHHGKNTTPEDLKTLLKTKDSSSIALQANVRYPFLHKLVDEINEHPDKF